MKEAAWEDYQSSLNDYLGIAETLWAAYNAAVWAVDWVHRSQRDRVEDLCLGDGARLKERALTLARRWLANGSEFAKAVEEQPARNTQRGWTD